MKDGSPFPAKSGSPRIPILLRQGGMGSESFIVSKEAAPSPLPTPSKIVHFEAQPDFESENIQLKEELAECHASLEQWTQTEAEWGRQRRLFKVMTENVSDLIVLLSPQGNRLWNNPAYGHALGYMSEELAGTHAFSEVHPEDRNRAGEAFDKAVSTGLPQQAEYRVQQKGGAWIHLQTEAVPVPEPDGRIDSIVLLAHDTTETRHLTEALSMATTQATAAGMVEGMARDFDQVLTNVFGNLTIAKNLNGPNNAIAVRLNEIERSLQRARDLIEQMFSVSSSGDEPRQRVNLEPVVQEAVAAVLRGTMIRAQYVFPRTLPELEIDVEAFAHALRNIVTNSVQAMDKGVVRVASEYVPQEVLNNRPEIPLKTGNYIRLMIQDQGHGMSERAVARAFEPYFTTRHGSQGLGLTTALSVIQRLGGTIFLESTQGVGTTASIYLPAPQLSSSSATPSGPVSLSKTSSLPGLATKKRILLMDDEQMILDIVSRMLSHIGYEVKTCTDGSQAIAAYAKAKSSQEIFDVVIMDLVIPNGVGGQDAVHTLKKIDPNARVIASSGHLDHPVMLDYKKYGFTAALGKPYKLEKLQQMIENVIESPA